MTNERLKELLAIFGVLAAPIFLFAIWTWAAEPRNGEIVWHITLIGLPIVFVLGHLALIVLGLSSRAGEGARVLSVLFLSLDVLLAALLGLGLLLSSLETGLGSKLLGGMCLLLLVPVVGLGSGLLVVYRKRLA